ncbi:MAG: helix-turn-helix domain-containing protein [bacterium]|nr:helix-turn-helix domain-containing protein [bacterium]
MLSLIILTGPAVQPVPAQETPKHHRYVISTWTIEAGLPQNSVLNLVQTRDRYIWFGTQSGLVRFDGVAFRVYNRWNTGGLKNDRILSLYEDSRQTLWAGTDGGGLSRFDNETRQWTTITTKNGLSNNTIRAITEDHRHHLWAGTDNGLNQIADGKISRYNMDDGLSGLSVTTLAAGRGNTLWIGTNSGLSRLRDGRFQPVPLQNKTAAANAREITALHEDPGGNLWAGTENGLYFIKNSQNPEAFLPNHSIRTILRDNRGVLWVGTSGEGLFRFQARRFVPVNSLQELPGDFIESLLQDHEGNLWMGAYTAGLARLKPAKALTLGKENGLPENQVYTLLPQHPNRLWAGTGRKGLALVDLNRNKVIRTITAAQGLSGNRVRALWQDPDNTLWVGTVSGLNRVKDGKITIYTTRDGLSSNTITAIHRDRSRTLRVGTVNGLHHWSPTRRGFEVYQQSSAPLSRHIRTLLEDPEGNIFIGTRGGLFILPKNGDVIRDMHPRHTATPFDYDILALHRDHRGYLWAGTNGSGLIRIKPTPSLQLSPSQLTFFTTRDGLVNNYIFSITGDETRNLWLSSYRGVSRVSPGDLQRLARSKTPGSPATTPITLNPFTFDEKEGMISSECSMAGQPAAWHSPGGKVYIPTVKGIAIIDPASPASPTAPPPTVIQNVIADNQPVLTKTGGSPPLLDSPRVMEFYFTALHFTSPQKVRLRYMLEGYDSHWNEVAPRQQRTAIYLNLPAGNYNFTVTARGNHGDWNPHPAGLTFNITAPGGKQSPALFSFLVILSILLILVILVLFWFSRNRRNRKGPIKEDMKKDLKDEPGEPKEKYKTSALLPETVEAVLPALTRMMETEKLYLDPQLNLKNLSQRLHVHYNHLSRIINENMGKSFNDYINGYRIEEAKKRLTDPASAQKTVLEIAYDTGFYSKSVFNTAFKKFTGMTPSQFRKKFFSS